MAKVDFSPYNNEADCLQIDDLNIENRVDRVSIYGSIDLTLDKQGLKHARQLKEILDLTIAELEKGTLPERIVMVEPEIVKNPFA